MEQKCYLPESKLPASVLALEGSQSEIAELVPREGKGGKREEEEEKRVERDKKKVLCIARWRFL